MAHIPAPLVGAARAPPGALAPHQPPTHIQGLLVAVGRCLLVAFPALLPLLAEEHSLLMQEEMPLHGLEPCQLFHLGVALLVVRPHAERTLHQQLAQVTQVALERSVCTCGMRNGVDEATATGSPAGMGREAAGMEGWGWNATAATQE